MSQGFTSQLPVPLPTAQGGTGLTSTTAYAVLCGGTTSTGNLQSIAGVGTSGQVLTSNGAGALPTFQAVSGANGNIKAFVAFDGTTSPGTINASSGVSSVTRNATGDFTVNLSPALADQYYSVSALAGSGGVGGWLVYGYYTAAPTSSAFRMGTGNLAGTNLNFAYNSVTFVR